MNIDKSLKTLLNRFDSYHPSRIDLTLDRIIRLLRSLGQPHLKLPPVIHVAGTNGKGSTIAFLRAIFEASGLVVSAYTSPHLIQLKERFLLGGRTISNYDLYNLLNEVEIINDGKEITEYEIITAAAFLSLSRTKADVVLLETGLGGRYDATNVVDKPILTVITPISLDHEIFLGPDIASISAEKAAIQKKDVPSVVAYQPTEAFNVIEDTALKVGAPVFRGGRDWFTQKKADSFIYKSKKTTLPLPIPNLIGFHQIQNASTAIACIEMYKKIDLLDKNIANGLKNVNWPGRFMALPDGNLRKKLPKKWNIWLDAGHNEAAGKVLAKTVRQINTESLLPLHIIFCMLEDKDPSIFLRPFIKYASSITAVDLPDEPRSHNPQIASVALTKSGIKTGWDHSLEASLYNLSKTLNEAHILICGSHAIVGAALLINSKGTLGRAYSGVSS
ncbi:MAG: bifunctional folylpolyglutamate synthase/dihydrofolate synthase [Alphaproteobacteria bacterium]